MDMMLLQVGKGGKMMPFELKDDGTLAIGHTMEFIEDKWTCSCALHRFKHKCKHSDALGTDGKDFKWHGTHSGNEWGLLDIIPEEEDVGIVFLEEGHDMRNRPLLISPPKSDVHMWQIMDILMKRDVEIEKFEDLGDSETRTLSRISRELTNAFMQGVPFTNPNVTEKLSEDDFVIRNVEVWTKVEGEKTEPEEEKPPKKTGIVWKDKKPPEGFYVEKAIWEAILSAALRGTHVLLLGPTGCGKSEIVYHVAEALKLDIECINFGAMSEARTSLIGATHLDKDTGTYFNKSRFVQAVEKESGIILGDEVTRAPQDAFNLILPLLDRQGYLSLDESEDAAVIYKGKSVAFFATANVGIEYTGTMAMDRAFKDRFKLKVELDYPPESREVEVLKFRCPKLGDDVIRKLVSVAHAQRGLAREGEFMTQISTRMLIDCGEEIEEGHPVKDAIRFTILGCFDSEGDEESERAKCATVFQKERLI